MTEDLFNQADINKDQRLDIDEFRGLLIRNLGVGSASSGAYGDASAAGGNYSGGFESLGTTVNGAGFAGGESSYGSFNQSAYSSTSGVGASSFNDSTLGGANVSGFGASASSGFDLNSYGAGATLSNETGGFSSQSTAEASTSQQQFQLATNNQQNLFHDPNPQIVRRPAPGGSLTYTQNIRVRFLQPPPVPPPGPLIIKEVRAPQPPPPVPLRIRQQAPPLPQPLPLVLRERPPNPPAVIASQTVIRRLAAIPVPPRSVIIERLPPLPPKPRDIIIERWVPYGAQPKRKTIVQRAEAAKEYPKPRNIIVQYEPVQVRVVRQFQRLGVTPENPQAYMQRYRTVLLDAQSLVQQARTAGVVEDISAPRAAGSSETHSTAFNAQFTSGSSGIETSGSADFTLGGGVGHTVGGEAGASASSFESFNYGGGSGQQENASYSGIESAHSVGVAHDFSSSYEANSSGFQGGSGSTTGYENYSASTGDASNFAANAFSAADTNKDGTLDAEEFRRFLSSQI
ncbi:unnamed protein product [Rotaria socialis]|uniref:EF-hand domain-containing protein n=1 Tax=Rotaria socialis TaxID=392032 RepID=A0A818ZY23_9BILA|nr:unnamed protein product [Rotaria socialis]CAF3351007.1 unnamed protein product [Rotaria socialis]CAF3460947.1 unnamed protein product [Rotaria socialis]CAF3778915.1 unnamed protein product [Rotaria socialis]